MKKTCICVCLILLVLLLAFGLSCVGALIFMALWNWIMPLFGVVSLTFWQSWGLSMLISIVAGKFNFDKVKETSTEIEKLVECYLEDNKCLEFNKPLEIIPEEKVNVINDPLKTHITEDKSIDKENNAEALPIDNTVKVEKPKRPRRAKVKKVVNENPV